MAVVGGVHRRWTKHGRLDDLQLTAGRHKPHEQRLSFSGSRLNHLPSSFENRRHIGGVTFTPRELRTTRAQCRHNTRAERCWRLLRTT